MAEYTSLLSDLSENITNEDLEQLKSACKEDIPEDQSNNITSSKEWFSYLEKNDKLAQGEEPPTRFHFFTRTAVACVAIREVKWNIREVKWAFIWINKG